MSELSLIPETLTMTSREIAELTGKRHDNVKRTIETLAERGVFDIPQIEERLLPGLTVAARPQVSTYLTSAAP